MPINPDHDDHLAYLHGALSSHHHITSRKHGVAASRATSSNGYQKHSHLEDKHADLAEAHKSKAENHGAFAKIHFRNPHVRERVGKEALHGLGKPGEKSFDVKEAKNRISAITKSQRSAFSAAHDRKEKELNPSIHNTPHDFESHASAGDVSPANTHALAGALHSAIARHHRHFADRHTLRVNRESSNATLKSLHKQSAHEHQLAAIGHELKSSQNIQKAIKHGAAPRSIVNADNAVTRKFGFPGTKGFKHEEVKRHLKHISA